MLPLGIDILFMVFVCLPGPTDRTPQEKERNCNKYETKKKQKKNGAMMHQINTKPNAVIEFLVYG